MLSPKGFPGWPSASEVFQGRSRPPGASQCPCKASESWRGLPPPSGWLGQVLQHRFSIPLPSGLSVVLVALRGLGRLPRRCAAGEPLRGVHVPEAEAAGADEGLARTSGSGRARRICEGGNQCAEPAQRWHPKTRRSWAEDSFFGALPRPSRRPKRTPWAHTLEFPT